MRKMSFRVLCGCESGHERKEESLFDCDVANELGGLRGMNFLHL